MKNNGLSSRSFFHRDTFFRHRPFSSVIHRSPRSEKAAQDRLLNNSHQPNHTSNYLQVPEGGYGPTYAESTRDSISSPSNRSTHNREGHYVNINSTKMEISEPSDDKSSFMNKGFYEEPSQTLSDSAFLTENRSTSDKGLVGVNVLDRSNTTNSTEDSRPEYNSPQDSHSNSNHANNAIMSTYSCGLPNLGNTCYMNSVLQCLCNTDHIYNYFMQGGHLTVKSGTELTQAFVEVLSNIFMKNKTDDELENSLLHFKASLEKVAPVFEGYSQNDAHEFFRLLIEKIHDELNQAPKQSESYEEFEPSKEVRYLAQLAEEWKKYSHDRDNSFIMKLFGGILLNEVICKNCSYVSYTFEDALDLSLNLANSSKASSSVNDHPNTLYSCLLKFSAEEPVEGYTCEKCQQTDKCVKKTSIWKQPEILTMQFKRFVYDNYGRRSAVKDKVAFPLDDLNMDYFTHGNSKEKRGKYKLYALVNHLGSLEAGHYIALVYNENLKTWLKYNDHSITKVDAKDMANFARGAVEPYVLFYKRV